MSEVKVNKLSPRSGTTVTIGDSGDTINIVGTLQNNGSALTGDISSVVAGTGLSGGGTSGDVTLNVEAAQSGITSLGTLTSATISGDLTVDTNTLFVDASENTVVVGGTDASSWNANADELVVAGASAGGMTFYNPTQTNIFFADGTSGDDLTRGRIQYVHSDNSLRFGTDTSERMRIDSVGSVGIGTSSPFNSRPGSLTVSNDTPTIYLEDTNASGREVGQLLYQDTNLTFSIGDRNGTGTSNSLELLKINNAGKIFTRQTAQFHDCVTIGGSPFTGDFQIEVSGLNAVNGGSWKQVGMRLSYASIADDASDAQTKDTLITLRGLSSYNSVTSVNTGEGLTVGITVDSATTTAVTFTVTSPGSSTVGAYVVTLFANDNSTMECNA